MFKPVPIPAGESVEKLAVAMAAVDGHFFPALDAERAAAYRRWANAALLRFGANPDLFGGPEASAYVTIMTERIANELRAAAMELEDVAGIPEVTIVRLFRTATQISDIGVVLKDGRPPAEEEF